MKNRLFKVMLATGAVAMICACGDDSGSGNDTPATNSADSGLPVTNPCAGYTVFHAGWIVELAPGDYWVVDKATSSTGAGLVYDKTGNLVDNTFFILDENGIGHIFNAEGSFLDLNMAVQTFCEANASIDPYTGEVIKSSESVPPTSSGAAPGSSGSVNPGSSGTVNPGSSANPNDPLSSAAVNPGSSGSVVPGSSADEIIESSSSVKNSGNPEEDVKNYSVPTLKTILGNGTSGWNTRYWDACKAHCAQTSTDGAEGKPKINTQEEYEASHYTARVCNINDIEIPTFTYSKGLERYWIGIQNTPNACQEANPASGGGFTCTDMAPVAVNDTLAYAFVAGSDATTSCGKCFHLQYDGSFKDADGNNAPKATHKALKGKHIIVMASNIGHDVKPGQFDLMVPGGGPGIFNALQLQITKPGIEWGATYGGFLTYCQNNDKCGYDGTLDCYQSCVKNMCDAAFGDSKYPNLLRGCHWFADWFMAADNPTYQWEEVECPQYLVDKYQTTISTSIETNILFQSDWSKYKGGDFITTDACSKTMNAQGEYCDPDQLAADKAKTY